MLISNQKEERVLCIIYHTTLCGIDVTTRFLGGEEEGTRRAENIAPFVRDTKSQKKRRRKQEREMNYWIRRTAVTWASKNPTGSNQAKGGIMYIFIFIYIYVYIDRYARA